MIIKIISDIHFGALDYKQLLHEIRKCFLKKLKEEKKVDVIIIDGDLFHKKLSLNSGSCKAAMVFLTEVCEIAKAKGATVCIIQGTESHDNDQLENLNVFKEICDFRIYKKVTIDFVKDMKMLFIPEEYIDNKDEYYQEYLKGEYDFIFGHGMVEEVSFKSSKQESEVTLKKAPVFKTKELLDICKGYCVFGHIHTHQKINKRFYYCGSYSRWCFGEEEDKGFMSINYNIENPSLSEVEFIVNDLAIKYDTIKIENTSSDVKKLVYDINEMLTMAFSLSDKLRLIVNNGEDVENVKLVTNILSETFGKVNNLKLVINNNMKKKIREHADEKIERLLNEYGFIYDKSITIEEKIQLFVSKKYQRNISLEDIRNYLYNPIE